MSVAPVTDEERRRNISVKKIVPSEGVDTVMSMFNRHLHYSVCTDRNGAGDRSYYEALALTVRDHLASRWLRTKQYYYEHDVKVRFSPSW